MKSTKLGVALVAFLGVDVDKGRPATPGKREGCGLKPTLSSRGEDDENIRRNRRRARQVAAATDMCVRNYAGFHTF
jgi:hypothetical protein